MTTEASETKITSSEDNEPGTTTDGNLQEPASSSDDGIVVPTANSSGIGLSRGNLLLAVLALVQIGLAAYMLWPRSTVGEAGAPLMGELESSDIIGLTIAEGEREIRFDKDGADWAIAGTEGFLTNEDSDGTNKVVAALEKLLVIDGNRLVTKTPSSHKRLQVAADDFVRKVTATTSDGEQTIYIGSSAGSGATHVRLDGFDEAYLTNEISSFELSTSASSWVDTQYFALNSDEVTAFTLDNGNGTFIFERDETESEDSPGQWIMTDLTDDEMLDQTKINTLVNQATNLRMTQPVGKSEEASYGLDSEGANITFTIQESGEGAAPTPQTVTLLIGASSDESTDHYAKASSSEFVVLVSQFNANQLLDKARVDFLVEPEEGESAGAVGEGSDSVTTNDGSSGETEISVTNGGTFTVAEPLTSTGVLTAPAVITVTENVTNTGVVTE